MVDIPWSSKPKINDLVTSDVLMRRTPSQTVKNQEIPFIDVIPFIYENISLLPDGASTITSAAQVPFVEGGVASRVTIRPNPPRQINVTSQAQLEAELPGLVIPDGENVTIVIDESFILTLPIKIGLNSFLEIYSSTVQTALGYIGPGALFQNNNPADLIGALIVHNLLIDGDTTNSVFDIAGTSSLDMDKVTMSTFDSVGTTRMAFVLIDSCSTIFINKGLVIRESSTVVIEKYLAVQLTASDITFISILNPTVPVNVDINAARTLFSMAGDSMVFFDPNSATGSVYTITKSDTIGQDLYQLGTDIAINSVANNGGIAQFTTATPHVLVVGRPVVLSGFTEPTYNGTFIVTAIPTGTTFDVEEITFTATDTGNMNASSLDNTAPKVTARDNPNSGDSMSSAQVGFTNIATPIVVPIATQDVPVLIGGTQFISDNLERATATTGGQITNLTKQTRKYPVTFSGLIEKAGGGATDIGILLIKNGSLTLLDTFEIPHSVNAGIIQISATRDFELADGDTIELAVVNFSSTADINVSQANISYSVNA